MLPGRREIPPHRIGFGKAVAAGSSGKSDRLQGFQLDIGLCAK
jgi:hypothetical protein